MLTCLNHRSKYSPVTSLEPTRPCKDTICFSSLVELAKLCGNSDGALEKGNINNGEVASLLAGSSFGLLKLFIQLQYRKHKQVQIPLSKNLLMIFDKGYRPETSYILLLLSTGFFLSYSISIR